MKLKDKEVIIPLATIFIETISIILVLLAFSNIIEFNLAILFLGISQAFGGINHVLKDKTNKYEKMLGDFSIFLGCLVMFISVLRTVF